MPVKTLLITPPFTQLNTPYPATAYLKGFLDSKNKTVIQWDLSIALFAKLFTQQFIGNIFREAVQNGEMSFPLVYKNKEDYITKVDKVTSFLRKQDLKTADELLAEGFFPKGH